MARLMNLKIWDTRQTEDCDNSVVVVNIHDPFGIEQDLTIHATR